MSDTSKEAEASGSQDALVRLYAAAAEARRRVSNMTPEQRSALEQRARDVIRAGNRRFQQWEEGNAELVRLKLHARGYKSPNAPRSATPEDAR